MFFQRVRNSFILNDFWIYSFQECVSACIGASCGNARTTFLRTNSSKRCVRRSLKAKSALRRFGRGIHSFDSTPRSLLRRV